MENWSATRRGASIDQSASSPVNGRQDADGTRILLSLAHDALLATDAPEFAGRSGAGSWVVVVVFALPTPEASM
jgi:hypothetical protein